MDTERQHWEVGWQNFVLSDKLRFCLGMHDDCKRVRHLRKERTDI